MIPIFSPPLSNPLPAPFNSPFPIPFPAPFSNPFDAFANPFPPNLAAALVPILPRPLLPIILSAPRPPIILPRPPSIPPEPPKPPPFLAPTASGVMLPLKSPPASILASFCAARDLRNILSLVLISCIARAVSLSVCSLTAFSIRITAAVFLDNAATISAPLPPLLPEAP